MPYQCARAHTYIREFSKENSKLNETRYFSVSFKRFVLHDDSFEKTPKSQHLRDIYLVKYYQDNRTGNCIPKK